MKDIATLIDNVERVLFGKRDVITLTVVGLLAEGHVLLEDAPGTGKTTLARALARSIDAQFRRIQFTSDMLPADVLGVSIWDEHERTFHFRRGPVFGNIILADELNRATPRTQSALLECMNERQISMDGFTESLPAPFMVLATQNPLEYEGTYPLPESQLDRFLLCLRPGYPDRDAERRALLETRQDADLVPVFDPEDIRAWQTRVTEVKVHEDLVEWLLDIVAITREHPHLSLGASPRASTGLLRAARALALVEGREFCIPDDIKRLVVPGLAHRIVPRHAEREASREILGEILAELEPPS